MPVAGTGCQGGVEAVPGAPRPWLQHGVALPHGRDRGPSGGTRPASCTSPGARMAHRGHGHRVILKDAPLCFLSWMAKVSLKRVWNNAKPTHTPLRDGPQAPHLCGVETLLFGSLTLRGSRYPCYKYICVCTCIYEYRNTDEHVVFIYYYICQISQELE